MKKIPLVKSPSGDILLKVPYDERPHIPLGVWNYPYQGWEYPATIPVYKKIKPLLKRGKIYPVDIYGQTILEELADKEILWGWGPKPAPVTKDIIPVPMNFIYPPFEHQVEAFYKLKDLDNIALWMEQGTGKTLVALALQRHWFLRGVISRTLIVTPKSAMDVWPAEITKHSPQNQNLAIPYEVKVFTGKKEKRIEELKKWKRDDSVIQVAMVNYEVISDLEKALEKFRPDLIILDESHKIKSSKAGRSKALHRLRNVASKRVILSGSIIAESPLDVFSQYKFLDPQIYGKKYQKFQRRYAIMGGFYQKEVRGYKNLRELTKKALNIGYRISKEEALDLPPEVDQFIYCDLTNESRRIYEKMKKKSVASFLGSDSITADIVLTQIGKLTQITGGYLQATDEDRVVHSGREKIHALEEVIEGLSKSRKLVIYAVYTPEVEAIYEAVKESGRTVRMLDGRTKERGKLIKEFQEKKDPSTLVIQYRTGSESITLTSSSICIFYSLAHSYTNYNQARARIHRIGQKEKTTFVHILAKNTIDEDVLKVVQGKKKIVDLVDSFIQEEKGGSEKMSKKHTKKRKSTGTRVPVSPTEETNFYKKRLEELRQELDKEGDEVVEAGDEEIAVAPAKKKKKKRSNKKDNRTKSVEKDKDEKSPAAYYEGAIVTVKDIAYDVGVSSTIVRKKLRTSDLEKPSGRWEWPADHPDIEVVKGWFQDEGSPQEEEIEEEAKPKKSKKKRIELDNLSRKELKQLCKHEGVKVLKKDTEEDLIKKLIEHWKN